MNKKNIYSVFLVLGVVWLIMGLIIYPDSAIWPLGFIFLIIGFIGKYSRKEDGIIS